MLWFLASFSYIAVYYYISESLIRIFNQFKSQTDRTTHVFPEEYVTWGLDIIEGI